MHTDRETERMTEWQSERQNEGRTLGWHLSLWEKLNFILFEVVPSEVVTPTKYSNSVKFLNFILMFTGGSTWTKFLLYRNVWRLFQFTYALHVVSLLYLLLSDLFVFWLICLMPIYSWLSWLTARSFVSSNFTVNPDSMRKAKLHFREHNYGPTSKSHFWAVCTLYF